MASYQNIAENGPSICQGPEKIVKCPDSLAGLPPADGLMLLDSNLGLSGMTLFSIDPAVVSEENAQPLNPELDMYNPRNGFNPKVTNYGTSAKPINISNGSKYSNKFVSRFSDKAGRRMNELIEKALDRLEKINAGKGRYIDDEPFIVPGGNFKAANNRLFSQDLSLWSHTRNAWPLLHPDGTITTEVVHTVRVPENTASTSPSLEKGGLTTTVRRFLSTFAIRPTHKFAYDDDSLPGIDFKSSYSNPVDSVAGIKKPLLQMGMTGHWEFFVAETIFENVNVNNTDKTLAYVEGATHGWTPCTNCALVQGQPATYYGDTVKTLFDYVDGWLSKPGRF